MALAGAALSLLAGLLGLLALLSPVAAQSVTLVSNANQGDDSNWDVTNDRSQAFTTGATGATLSSVGIISEDGQGDAFAVSLCTVDASDHPTSSCTDLTPPSSFAAGTVVFTPPDGTTLNANTTYALLVTNTAKVRLDATSSDNEDVGGATGWSIANDFDHKSTSDVWVANGTRSLRITIKGTLDPATNNAPTVATEILDQTATTGAAFSFAFPAATFADADAGDTLTYTATLDDDSMLPSWLSFDAATRTFSGTPTTAETVSVKVTASDASESVSDTFDIVVSGQTDTTFISNSAQVTSSTEADLIRATAFTTGGNSGGYGLSSVDVYAGILVDPLTPVVEIYVDNAGEPGTLHATLSNPATVTQSSSNTFTATNITLSATTTYWLVTSNSATINNPSNRGQGFRVSIIPNATADTGAATGWSIGNSRYKIDITTANWTFTNNRGIFTIRGTLSSSTNTAPTVATEIPNQTAMSGTAFSYQVPAATFADTDAGDTLTYTATLDDDSMLPSWLSFDAATRTFSGTPTAAETVSVKVTASDASESVSDTFDIVVSGQTDTTFISNSAQVSPTRTSFLIRATAFTTGSNSGGYGLSSVDVYVGTRTAFNPLVEIYEDNAGAPGTLHATLSDPATVTGNSANTFTATNTTLSATTTYWLVTRNSDSTDGQGFRVNTVTNTTADTGAATGWSIGNGGYKSDNSDPTWTSSNRRIIFTIKGTITASSNNAPTVATAISDQTATTGTAFNYQVPDTTFTDADSDTLTYSATLADDSMLPSWLSFDAATRTFSGTPTAVETVSVKVTASDASESVSDTFDIVVSATADTTPPEVDSAELGASTTGDNLVITFDENLDQTAVSIGLGSAFSVTADGQLIDISLISGFDATVTLRASLSAPAIRQGQTVVVGYTDPTAGDDTVALQDIAGNDVASFTTGMAGVPAVTNNSTSIAPTGAPTITGTAQVGETLTAVTTGIMDANGLTSPTYTYQWIRANGTEADIASANSSTYTLDAADLGKTIKVKVSFTDDTSNAETLTSAATATVTAATGICSRTAEVQTALLAATSRTTCSDVTAADLVAVTSLTVNNYSGTVLDPADFAGLTGLTNLLFGGSPQLTTLPDNAFAGVTALTHLDFNSLVTVTMVAEDAFSGLTALENLNLSGNDLTMLDADIFDGLTSLRILNLSFTSLTTLAADIFNGLTALEEIDLSFSSNMAALDEDTFDGLTALHTLDLSFTALTTLDADIYDGLTALRLLSLSGNRLTTLDADIFDGLTALSRLELQGNRLTALDADIFDGLTALEQVYLSANLLTTLDADIFDGLTLLQEISLDRNSLDTLDADIFDGLTALQKLQLQDNRLTALHADIFDGLTVLELLDLNCNYFTALDFDIFDPFTATLTSLDLRSDSFTTPPTDAAIRAKFPAISTVLTGSWTCDRVTVSPTSLTVTEGATGTLSVALRSLPTDDVTLAISSDNPDVTVTPTTALTFTVDNWDTAQTVTVSAAEDTDQADESATLILNPDGDGNKYPFVFSTALTVTVTDDDGTAVTGICSRTAEVQTAILDVTGRATCSDVTAADLVAVTSLPVSNYSGTTLDPADFAGLTGLTNLEIDDSPQLTTVPNNAFAGLTALTTLNFWFFSLTTLGEDAFAGLTVLTSLDLNFDDSLAALDAEIFDGLTALEHLDLSRNLLTTLDADIFDGLTALSTLTLQDNLLTTLDEDIFEDLTDLETLYLTSNLLTTLNADIFDGLTALDTLDLGHNGLTTLDADIFDDLTALRILGLSVNGLTTLDADIFDDTAMETLALDSNLLTTLDADLFDGLTALNTLYLDSNLFTTLDADLFDGLTALTRLELQDNRLTALDADIFDGITLLERLDLECNYFTALDLNIFNPFAATLTYLDLMSDSFTTPPVESAIRAKFPMITDVLIGVTPCLRVTVSPTSLTVTEGATGTYTVALRAQPSGDVMVAISSDNPDVTVAPTTPLTFTAANWDTAQMVTVSAAQDPDQADEAATLILDPDGNDYDLVISTVLTVTVTDDDGTAVNNAPTVATMIPDQTATSGRALDYTFPADTFTDADGDTLTYTATLADDSALPSWLSFAPATRTFSGTPTAVETVSVKVTASDGNGGSVSDTFDIVVSAPLPAIIVEADRAKATGKVDFITYTLTREGDTAAALTVTLTFEGPAGNDWGLDPAGSAMRQVTFGAGQATVTQIIKLALGFGNIGFNQSTTEGGTLTARLGAVTGYDTSDTDEVVVVVVAGPAWVIQLSETAYRFTEDGGAQTIVVEATAGSAEMPPPSVSTSNTSAVTSALLTVTGTALAETTMITGDYVSLTETVNTLASGCSVGADNVLVCRTEVTLTLVDDDVAEPDETFDLVLSSAPGSGPAIRHQGPDGMSSSAGNVYPVTIRDDDFAVTGVTLTSTPLLLASGSSTADTYGEGERIEFSVAFTRPVTVTGAPTFSFVLGTATKTATYASGSDSETLLFAYTVTSSDMDTDGISWAANTLALAGGTIAGTGNLEHSAQTARTGHRVDGSRNAANIPPTLANEIPNQMAMVGTAFNYAFLANTFNDADGDTLTYTATLADDSALPTWLTFSAATRAFSGTPQAADVGTVAVKVTASDGNGESVSDSFDIVVSVAMDTTGPRVASIVRQNPTVSPTNADSLTWRVTFSEAVSNVNAADFAVSGTTATVTAVAVSGLTGAYDVSASGGNLAALNATVTLAIAASHNIEDGASNSLTNTTPTGTNDNSYVVDNTAPSVTISGVPASSDAPFTATFTFPEAVTGFAVGDITLGNATASSFTVTSTTVYRALVTPTAAGAVTVDVPANAAQDAAGNGNTAATRATSTYSGTAALPAITIAAGASPVTEGTSAVFTLSRTGSTTDALTVNVTVSEAGGDMVAASNEGARTVTFLANSATATLSVATVPDSIDEANSVVTATVSADTGSPASYSVGAPGSAMVTVRDDDSNITVPGAPTDLSASSGGNTRINLSWTAPGDDGGSPIIGYKIEVSPDGNANWTELVATGNTTTTYAHIGLAVGTTRHYRVSAINSVGAGDPSNIDDATVIITTVTLRTQSIPEGIGTAAVLVTLNQPAGDPLSVPWYTLNGDAVSPGDYTAGAGQLIIPSGATSATISITIIDDADAEATETVLVLLSPGEGYALGGSGATLSILDDDGAGPAPIRATVDGATVVLTYNKSLDGASTPSSTAFHLRVADNRASVDEVSVNGSEVTLTLASPVQAGQTVSLDYTQPMSNPIQDGSGHKAQSFTRWYLVTGSTITNDRPSPSPASRPISRHQPAGIPGSTSHGPPPATTAVPPSPATRSRSRPTATPTGPSSSPIQATPPPPTRTAAWPSARPATTGCPPSTLPAPADPPTSTTPLSSSRP